MPEIKSVYVSLLNLACSNRQQQWLVYNRWPGIRIVMAMAFRCAGKLPHVFDRDKIELLNG
jgi:hypothetical protein